LDLDDNAELSNTNDEQKTQYDRIPGWMGDITSLETPVTTLTTIVTAAILRTRRISHTIRGTSALDPYPTIAGRQRAREK
jgi:hypothetical protein